MPTAMSTRPQMMSLNFMISGQTKNHPRGCGDDGDTWMRDAYFTRPTAFMTSPMPLLPCSMKAACSAGGK